MSVTVNLTRRHAHCDRRERCLRRRRVALYTDSWMSLIAEPSSARWHTTSTSANYSQHRA